MEKSAPPTKVRTLSCESYYSLNLIKLSNKFNVLIFELNPFYDDNCGGML